MTSIPNNGLIMYDPRSDEILLYDYMEHTERTIAQVFSLSEKFMPEEYVDLWFSEYGFYRTGNLIGLESVGEL